MADLEESIEGMIPKQFCGILGGGVVALYNYQYNANQNQTMLGYNVVGGLVTGFALSYFGASYMMCVVGSALGAYAAPTLNQS